MVNQLLNTLDVLQDADTTLSLVKMGKLLKGIPKGRGNVTRDIKSQESRVKEVTRQGSTSPKTKRNQGDYNSSPPNSVAFHRQQ